MGIGSIRNLAVYKISGEPWTIDEFVEICTYCDGGEGAEDVEKESLNRTYIIDDGSRSNWMILSDSPQQPHGDKLINTFVSYEELQFYIDRGIEYYPLQYKLKTLIKG